jgi:hypothetical protein
MIESELLSSDNIVTRRVNICYFQNITVAMQLWCQVLILQPTNICGALHILFSFIN